VTETSNYRSELVSRIRRSTDDLGWAVRGLTSAQWSYSAGGAEWNIHEHVSHLRDMEQQVYLPLLRWATVPDMLDPRDYNRREWHENRYRRDEPIPAILHDLAKIRDEELVILRDITDMAWSRYRTDTRWGPLTCQWIAELIYRHVLDHTQGVMGLLQDVHLAAVQPPALAGGVGGGTTP